ncbi:MAG: hypothetical protein AAGF55_14520, partial [Pseudomonadota bacterium]
TSRKSGSQMQILFHLGAHCTDNGLLIRSILRNRARLAEDGIGVPGPGRYRELIGDVSTTLRGETANEDTEAMVVEAIRDDETADRIVLSNENFLCRPGVALAADGLYPKARKSAWLRESVPSHGVEFALAIRNPATFVPELVGRNAEAAEALKTVQLGDLFWSDVISDILTANPDTPLYIWCHEDTPFIWSELMRELTGHDPYMELDGEFDMLETIISEDGMARLQEFLDARDVTSQSKRRKAVSAFLEAHAIQEKVETEIDIEGWTSETVDALSELYEDDINRISKMDGVTFITP